MAHSPALSRAHERRRRRRRLSGEDAGFLYLEQPAQPLNVLALALITPDSGPDGVPRPLTLEYLRGHFERRLDALPFLRWCVRPVPLRLHHPVFVDDPHFTLDRHLVQVDLPSPGTPDQLDRFCSSLVQRHFDRRHPMWQIILVDGLDDGRQAVITRLHHCLMDGAAALRTYSIIFSEDDPLAPSAVDPAWHPRRAPSRWRLLAEALDDQLRAAARVPGLISWSITNFRAANRQSEHAIVAVPKTPQDTPPSLFNDAFTRPQVLVSTSLPLADLAEIRHASGVSRNDVLLGVMAGAVRGYLLERQALPDRPLVSQVPVAIATPEEPERVYGNHIFTFSTTMATDVVDPWERLKAISAVTAEAKANLEVINPELIWEWLDLVPPVIAQAAATHQYRMRRKVRTVADQNLLVSHFRGPHTVWRLGPATCDAFYWFGPPNQGVGLNISGWNYAENVLIGIDAYADALDDPAGLVGWIQTSMSELLAVARTHHQRGLIQGDPTGGELAS